jgi:hypothetical protein
MVMDWFTKEYFVDESSGFHGAAEDGIAFHALNKLNTRSLTFDEFEFYPFSGSPWVGRFQRAVDNQVSKTVYSTPVPGLALVVAGQQGYFVDVLNRTAKSLPSPVLQVEACIALSTLVLADFTTLTLMSASGEVWSSPRLVTDDLKIICIEASHVTIEGFIGEFGDVRKSVYRIGVEPLGVDFVKWL